MGAWLANLKPANQQIQKQVKKQAKKKQIKKQVKKTPTKSGHCPNGHTLKPRKYKEDGPRSP